jgi:hypothetical protein
MLTLPILLAVLSVTDVDAPPLVQADAVNAAPPQVKADTSALEDVRAPTTGAVTVSPASVLMLALAVELELRVSDQLTAYAAGEYYGAWSGFGVQVGARLYTAEAFHGLFFDLHARASDLYLVHAIGAGLEVGSQHALGQNGWTLLWSAGVDVGAGAWGAWGRDVTDVPSWFSQGLVLVPKLRFMLGHTF